MGIKVTEMTEATQVNNNDWLMIVQNGENKKITKENLQGSIVDAELEERVDTLEDDVDNKIDKVEGKGLSTNDYTDNDKNKLNSIESGAEINVIEGIKVNGSDLTPDSNKKVNISVPTKVSDLNNDLHFIDNTVNNLTNYTTTTDLNTQLNNKANKSTTLLGYGIEDAYTKDEVDTKISSVYKYKGSVNAYADLPSTNLTIGDVYNIATADTTHHIKAGDNVAWTGTEWDTLGGEIDLTDYYTKTETYSKTETNNLLNNKLNITDLISFVYPVGSIYMSVNNVSPATFIGGTWEQIKDRFLLSAGDTYLAGDTGGSATHSHPLSRNAGANFRKFANKFIQGESTLAGVIQKESESNKYWITDGNSDYSADTPEKPGVSLYGNTDVTTNLPPYLAVYMWKRTA